MKKRNSEVILFAIIIIIILVIIYSSFNSIVTVTQPVWAGGCNVSFQVTNKINIPIEVTLLIKKSYWYEAKPRTRAMDYPVEGEELKVILTAKEEKQINYHLSGECLGRPNSIQLFLKGYKRL